MFPYANSVYNENQLILILAGLFYCTVLEWGQDYCYERFKSLLILNNPPIETANNKVTALHTFHGDLHHGQCIVYLV
jgi:hypothetical protein